MKLHYSFLAIFIILLSSVKAEVVFVPADYPNIQNAIDNVDNNDTIVITSGVYFENPIISKPITLASNFIFSNDPGDIENTIIDGNQSGSVITVQSIPNDTVRFIGLTVTNGNGTLCDPQSFGYEQLHGGGFYIKDVYVTIFDNMLIRENQILTAHNSAGGVFCQNSLLLVINSKIKDNLIRGESGFGEGAGLYFYESETQISDSEITGNSSFVNYGEGGGIYAKNSTLEVTNNIINNNECINGGAMYITDSDLEIHNCSFDNNLAHITGAIVFQDFGEHNFLMTSTTVNGNEGTNTIGAFKFYNATAEIHNCEINNNIGGYSGGAFSCAGSDISIYDSEINNNEAISGIGGDGAGMSLYNCNVYLNNVVFDENFCSPPNSFNKGGAIELGQSQLVMDSVVISNNTADEGAAIYCNSSSIRMNYTLIHGHNAQKGGAIYAYGSEIEIVSSNIYDNSAPTGGGIHSENNHLVFVNSILWDNTPSEIYFRYINPDDTTYVHFAYSNVRGLESNFSNSNSAVVTWHDGNLDTNPQFVNPDEGDFNLVDDSPLVDAGIDYFELEGNILVDLSPDQYVGPAPDIGAYENQNISTGLKNNIDSDVTVWPNPFTDKIKILNGENNLLDFDIIDNGGRVLRKGTVNSNNDLIVKIPNLKAGVYFIRFYFNNGTRVKKLVNSSN